MNLLLRLRHWQLFLISWGPLTTFFVLFFIRPNIVGDTLLVWVILFPIVLINSFAWVWSTVTALIPTITSTARPRTKLFNICFWIPSIYVAYIVGFIYFNFFVWKVTGFSALELKIHIGLALLSFTCIIYGLYFSAKTIKTAELQRNLKAYECLTELGLMILAPIGLWIIQPRLNKLVRG